jgi:hypothetical protein
MLTPAPAVHESPGIGCEKLAASLAPISESVQHVMKNGLPANRDGIEHTVVVPTRRIHPRREIVQQSVRMIGLIASAGLICTVAHAADDSLTNRQGDITPLCGTKPMIVGVSDGYGGNTWRKTGLAEVKDELSRCNFAKRVIYSNANGDPQRTTYVRFAVRQGGTRGRSPRPRRRDQRAQRKYQHDGTRMGAQIEFT